MRRPLRPPFRSGGSHAYSLSRCCRSTRHHGQPRPGHTRGRCGRKQLLGRRLVAGGTLGRRARCPLRARSTSRVSGSAMSRDSSTSKAPAVWARCSPRSTATTRRTADARDREDRARCESGTPCCVAVARRRRSRRVTSGRRGASVPLRVACAATCRSSGGDSTVKSMPSMPMYAAIVSRLSAPVTSTDVRLGRRPRRRRPSG